MAVQPIPEGYHTVTAYLIVKGAASAIDFYQRAFGATELFRMADRCELARPTAAPVCRLHTRQSTASASPRSLPASPPRTRHRRRVASARPARRVRL